MDDTDFDLLCKGLSADEAKRLRKIFMEWCDGDENGFPVQLVLLTLAQLRAAASVPRAIADSRKWLEQHLAEYRRQTQLLLDGFNETVQTGTRDFEATTSLHAKTIEKAANQIQLQLDDAKFVAKYIESVMDGAASQWKDIKASTETQCERLEQISDDLQDRFAWRVILQLAIFFLLVSGLSVLAGHYLWTH